MFWLHLELGIGLVLGYKSLHFQPSLTQNPEQETIEKEDEASLGFDTQKHENARTV